jgi:hypothetical protein
MIKSLTLLLCCTGACLHTLAQDIVASDLADKKAHQKTMAILPALAPLPHIQHQLKKMSPEQIQDMRDSSGLALQRSIYPWFITQTHDNTLDIQDPVYTDSLLQAANLSIKDVIYGEKTNLARILGVDVLMFPAIHSRETGGSSPDLYSDPYPVTPINSMVMIPGSYSNVYVSLVIDLYDGQDADHLWGYQGDRNGGYNYYYVKYKDKNALEKLLTTAYKLYPYKR